MALTRGQILSQPVVQDNDGVTGGSITLRDLNLSNEITFKAPDDVTSNYDIILPAAPPAVSGYILSFQTDGTASFIENTPTPGGAAIGAIQYRNNLGAQAGADYALYNDSNQSIDLVYNGATPTPIRWLDADTPTANFAAFQAPSDITRNYTVDLPALIPGTTDTTDSVGYVLKIASHSDQSVPGDTTAVLEWGPPITGDNQSQGAQFTVQIAGDAAGEFASATDLIAYNSTNALVYTFTDGDVASPDGTLTITPPIGSIEIGTDEVLTRTGLGSTVLSSSLTSVGVQAKVLPSGGNGIEVNNTVESAGDLILNAGGTGAAAVVIQGTNGAGVGRIEIEDQEPTPNSVAIDVPANAGTSYTLTLPASITTPRNGMALSFNSGYNATFIDDRKTLNFTMDGGGTTTLQQGLKGFYRVFLEEGYVIESVSLVLEDPTDGPSVTINRASAGAFNGSNATLLYSFNAGSAVSGSATNNAGGAITTDNGISGTSLANGDVLEFNLGNGPFNSTFATISMILRPASLT